MIKKLDWDTDFFGYPIGQTEFNFEDKKNEEILLKEAGKFKLVYLGSTEAIIPPINKAKLVDIKTKLSKEVKIIEDCSGIQLFEYDGGDPRQLRKLALQSGVYSRFKKDPNFINYEFEKLYTKWIEDSIKKIIADNVVVYKEGITFKAFITLKYKENFAEIGLIAVDEEIRGKGVGLALLSYVNNLTKEIGLNKIEVTTQFENLPAIRLYEKAGYAIVSKKYIYHLWN